MEEILRAIGRSDEAKPFVRLTLDSAAGAGHGRMSFRRVGSDWLGYSGRAERGECAQGRSNEGYPTKAVTLTRPGHKRITKNQQRQGRRRMAGPLAKYSLNGSIHDPFDARRRRLVGCAVGANRKPCASPLYACGSPGGRRQLSGRASQRRDVEPAAGGTREVR